MISLCHVIYFDLYFAVDLILLIRNLLCLSTSWYELLYNILSWETSFYWSLCVLFWCVHFAVSPLLSTTCASTTDLLLPVGSRCDYVVASISAIIMVSYCKWVKIYCFVWLPWYLLIVSALPFWLFCYRWYKRDLWNWYDTDMIFYLFLVIVCNIYIICLLLFTDMLNYWIHGHLIVVGLCIRVHYYHLCISSNYSCFCQFGVILYFSHTFKQYRKI